MPRDFETTVAFLGDEAKKLIEMGVDEPEMDAVDRVVVAIYQAGAAVAERLERMNETIEALLDGPRLNR